MKTIDDIKTTPPEEHENECLWCDKRCEKDFCSLKCAKNYLND